MGQNQANFDERESTTYPCIRMNILHFFMWRQLKRRTNKTNSYCKGFVSVVKHISQNRTFEEVTNLFV